MSEKSMMDRFLDVVIGEEASLPSTVALAAVRDGEETEFSYREWSPGWQAWQLVSTKQFLDHKIASDERMAGIVVTIHEVDDDRVGASIEMTGRAKTEVFGELMHNEFSHWTKLGRISRRHVGNMIRLTNLWLEFKKGI